MFPYTHCTWRRMQHMLRSKRHSGRGSSIDCKGHLELSRTHLGDSSAGTPDTRNVPGKYTDSSEKPSARDDRPRRSRKLCFRQAMLLSAGLDMMTAWACKYTGLEFQSSHVALRTIGV